MDNTERNNLIKARLRYALENLFDIQKLMLADDYDHEFNNIGEAIEIIHDLFVEF